APVSRSQAPQTLRLKRPSTPPPMPAAPPAVQAPTTPPARSAPALDVELVSPAAPAPVAAPPAHAPDAAASPSAPDQLIAPSLLRYRQQRPQIWRTVLVVAGLAAIVVGLTAGSVVFMIAQNARRGPDGMRFLGDVLNSRGESEQAFRVVVPQGSWT